MTGENETVTGNTAAAQALREHAEAKVLTCSKLIEDMSVSDMSLLIHELCIQQAEQEIQNEERIAELSATIEKLRREIEALKKGEQTLRDNEEKYRQLFENDSDAVMIFDAETGRFEDANQATLDLYGYSKEEFLRLKIEDLSSDREKAKSNAKKIKDGVVFLKRVPLHYFKKKDDTVFPGEISAGRFTIGGRKKKYFCRTRYYRTGERPGGSEEKRRAVSGAV